jgi:hydrogenase maturation protease
MNEVRIIGVGSPFGNDDIGWRVIDTLQRSNNVPRHVDLVSMDRPGISLLHLLQGAKRVILVDALLAAARYGEILILEQTQIRAPEKLYSSHDLDVAGTLQLAAKLELLPEQLSIVALAIDPDREQPVADTLIVQMANVVCSELARTTATARPCYS